MKAHAHWVTAFILAVTLSLHWAVLQTIAWTGMLISYSAQGSLEQAVSRTFDGAHPCALCKSIQQGRDDERRRDQDRSVTPGGKLEPGLAWQSPGFWFLDASVPVCPPIPPAASRSEEPPKPRPRADWSAFRPA